MKTPKTPRKSKAAKTNVEEIKRAPTINIPGQVRHKSVKDALRHVSETLGVLHVETHGKMKAR